MALTLEQLIKACDCSPHLGTIYLDAMNETLDRFDISDAVRQAAFLAQVAHESGRLVYTKELWGPTKAQRRYEPPSDKAKDLGNVYPGDGYKFRGRGLIQITGRSNYFACGRALGLDLIEEPGLLSQPRWAAISAGWFWQSHGCNELADGGDFVRLTRRINGGTNGLDDRLVLWEGAKEALGV